jgi:exodeoxyribonuclease-3
MTYNILNGAEGRIDDVIKVVKSVAPDVLVLNEANGFEKNNYEKLKYFGGETGLLHQYLETCGDGWDYHVAVLAKENFLSVESVTPVARAIIIAKINAGNVKCTIAGLHLTPALEKERMAESMKLLRKLSVVESTVIAGDFNSLSISDNYPKKTIDKFSDDQKRKFTSEGKAQYGVDGLFRKFGFADAALIKGDFSKTVPTKLLGDTTHPPVRLDKVLLSPDLTDKLLEYTVVKNNLTDEISDHYPVYADIKV